MLYIYIYQRNIYKYMYQEIIHYTKFKSRSDKQFKEIHILLLIKQK